MGALCKWVLDGRIPSNSHWCSMKMGLLVFNENGTLTGAPVKTPLEFKGNGTLTGAPVITQRGEENLQTL
ncbi:hypothetical protein DPMN_043408 [Dreissena polymorpha]|uniref:Uncharacterized protein n=1 Tax=Dreissena polymorpha TaxID=45954 RepID=A0A9D4D2R5_DREPO|nr:hypothetical protein DPMN_043408 [Dreissena polymorpha]